MKNEENNIKGDNTSLEAIEQCQILLSKYQKMYEKKASKIISQFWSTNFICAKCRYVALSDNCR